MPGSRAALLLVGAGVFALACAGPRTEYRSLPPEGSGKPPRGHPIYAAVLPGLDARVDGEPVDVGPDVTRIYVRLLRRASVFTEVGGPDSASSPGWAARLALETRLEIDPQTEENLGRSVLRGASLTLLRPALPLEIDLRGEMVLRVQLPGSGRTLEYQAATEATRFYQQPAHYQSELDILASDVATANLRSIIAQMRADPALTAETAPGEDPLSVSR